MNLRNAGAAQLPEQPSTHSHHRSSRLPTLKRTRQAFAVPYAFHPDYQAAVLTAPTGRHLLQRQLANMSYPMGDNEADYKVGVCPYRHSNPRPARRTGWGRPVDWQEPLNPSRPASAWLFCGLLLGAAEHVPPNTARHTLPRPQCSSRTPACSRSAWQGFSPVWSVTASRKTGELRGMCKFRLCLQGPC